MTNKEIPVYLWDEILTAGNKFNQIPHPDMLSDEFSKIKFISATDKSGQKIKTEAEVTYDRDYVIAYFARSFKYLFKVDSQVIADIINKAIKLRKKQVEDAIKEIEKSGEL
jgi:hypothetical protein